jgi:hypothetical protein
MGFVGMLGLRQIMGIADFFWFVLALNVGLFILVVIALRMTYSTYAICPIHRCEVQYIPSLDAHYCRLCSDFVESPEQVRR